ncbi:protein delta homolog 1 [Conger conger]|uniref:protein delta homolog 1 n=1 Tax=Conger conger TaxID=82655 RepID=UPI002A5A6384|nr:protein delta homolog 1 [Conger conger]
MHFRGLQSPSAFCLLILVITGISNGFECSPGCDPNNGFCEKPGECRCRPGWQGATCNQCVPFPGCRHGSCEKAWQCVCEEGWVGSQCDVDIHPCSSKPCYNNSTCTETGEGGYFCVCARGYTGDNCHLRTGPCLTNGSPCQNEGTCTDDNGLAAHPSCLCPPGFSGDFCEIDVDDCEPGPCANGGSCLDHGPSYTCLCPPGFTGPTCNTTLPPCAGYPCANGGTCLSRGDGTAHCLCPPGFTGPACARHRAKPARPAGREDGHHPPRYSLPSHMFHKLAHPPERKMLKITMKEAAHAPGPLVTRSQVICFAVLGLLTCLVVLGTTGIIFFNRCETWMANAKYTQLVRQQRDYLLSSSNGEEHSVNIILPEKIKLTSYGNHYTSI